METKNNYIKPDILVEEWKVYKKTVYHNKERVYEVSNFGRVKLNGVITEPHTRRNGYKHIGGFRIHRAVAELFIPNPENKPCVDHIDTNPSNNHVNNLRWVTYKENCNNSLSLRHKSESQKIIWSNPEYRQKQSEAQKIAHNRPEERQKQREAAKGNKNTKDRIYINKNNIRKMVKPDQLDFYLNNGWKLGMKAN